MLMHIIKSQNKGKQEELFSELLSLYYWKELGAVSIIICVTATTLCLAVYSK